MADTYDLDVSGPDGATVTSPPVNGDNADPPNPKNGADGQADKWHTCTQQAGPGYPGLTGGAAPPAPNGGNGKDAFGVTITCGEYAGGPLSLLNAGGTGGNGGNGGTGGNGSDGGNAGKQPKGCNNTVVGGYGGGAGNGGRAGGGGDGGNAGDVVILMGQGIPGGSAPTVNSVGGSAGSVGQPGQAGTPGEGGTGTDGTVANAGAAGGGGGGGPVGKGGYGGSLKISTKNDPQNPTSLKIYVYAHPSP